MRGFLAESRLDRLRKDLGDLQDEFPRGIRVCGDRYKIIDTNVAVKSRCVTGIVCIA